MNIPTTLKIIRDLGHDDFYLNAILEYYGDLTAKRSKVPLVNHIFEGLLLLEEVGASKATKQAFCIHPIFQDDTEFQFTVPKLMSNHHVSGWPLILVMEYRSIANRWTSKLSVNCPLSSRVFLLTEVRQMLIADKVQNRKDFELYHKGIHPNSDNLDKYFREWMKYLGVDEENYQRLKTLLENSTIETASYGRPGIQ